MKHRVCLVGRPSGWAKEAGAEFQKRIGRYAQIECVHLREEAKVEDEMLNQCEKGWWSICLDPQGKSHTTEEWRSEWEKWERAGHTRLVWMIGGADGFSEQFRTRCNSVRSMGPQTLSHDLALVVLMEQIYRLESWRAGHPYHRE